MTAYSGTRTELLSSPLVLAPTRIPLTKQKVGVADAFDFPLERKELTCRTGMESLSLVEATNKEFHTSWAESNRTGILRAQSS